MTSEKSIKICGKKVKMRYCAATETGYEQLSGKSVATFIPTFGKNENGEDIIVKDPKTTAGDRYVYFSPEMSSLLKEFRKECAWQTETYEERQLTEDDYVFRRSGFQLPMTPSTFHASSTKVSSSIPVTS